MYGGIPSIRTCSVSDLDRLFDCPRPLGSEGRVEPLRLPKMPSLGGTAILVLSTTSTEEGLLRLSLRALGIATLSIDVSKYQSITVSQQQRDAKIGLGKVMLL